MAEKDTFYDYSNFEDSRLEGIMKGWDGLEGYHGLLVRLMARLSIKNTVLDVGCGLGHLYEVLKTHVSPPLTRYVGVDTDDRVLSWVRQRYPNLEFHKKTVYDLSGLDVFDSVFAIGLYRYAPANQNSVREMAAHAKYCLNTCYYVEEEKRGEVLDVFKLPSWQIEFIIHDIDPKLEIIRLWNLDSLGA
jgi:SAM-dependent methyltransferase